MSPRPVGQEPATARPEAGAGRADQRRWRGASGPWPTGARPPDLPAAVSAAMTAMTRTSTTCPITSRHAGPLAERGSDRSSLVTAGTGRRADGRTAAGFDETDPALHAAYGHGATGYDGYDAAADTRLSGPMGAEPGTGPYATGGYDTGAYDPGSGPFPGYGGETPGRLSRSRPRRRARPGRRFSPRQVSGVRPGGHWRRDVPAAGSLLARGPGRDRLRRARGQDRARARQAREAAAGWRPRFRATGRLRRRADRTDRQPVPSRLGRGLPVRTTPAKPVTALPAGDGGSRRSRNRSCGWAAPGRTMTTIRGPVPTRSMAFPTISSGATFPPTSRWPRIARAAQAPSDSGQPWAPGDGPGRPGPSAGPGSRDMVSAPVPADAPAMGRGRRARGRAAEPEDGTEPRPRQQADGGAGGAVEPRGPGGPGGTARPGASGGSRRRGEPMRSPRGAEEDPLTSASFSRHAREASDSRSYRDSRQAPPALTRPARRIGGRDADHAPRPARLRGSRPGWGTGIWLPPPRRARTGWPARPP